jgi:hypothetical protein
MNDNSQEKLPDSNYRVKFSDDVGRVAVVDKNTGQVKESFSPVIADSFIIQRMEEIRKDELWRQQFMMKPEGADTPYSEKQVLKGGLILPDGY